MPMVTFGAEFGNNDLFGSAGSGSSGFEVRGHIMLQLLWLRRQQGRGECWPHVDGNFTWRPRGGHDEATWRSGVAITRPQG